jgi:pSer/pThr/pTyr-binding forkhead associated (FHA) protein
MGKLVLHLPDGTVQNILLGKERITIGRRSDNDVCLPYPAVSSEHARVVTILNDSFLEDLGSTNGTLVNGQRILKHLLCDNDQIDIGRQRLVYYVNEATQAEPLPPDVLLRDLEGLRDQVQRVRSRRSDALKRAYLPEPVEDDELLADLEQTAAPAGAERAISHSTNDALTRNTGGGPPRPVPAPPTATGEVPRPQREVQLPEREVQRIDGVPKIPVQGAHTVALDGGVDAGTSHRSLASRGAARTSVARTMAGGETSTVVAAMSAAAALESAPNNVGGSGAAGWWVRVLTGPNAGRELPVTGDEFWVGSVGHQVAKLVRREGAWTLTRVEGDEVLVLNGAPVSVDGAFVAPGDRFTVAGTEVEIERR